jgi:dTDP-4-amino-4,6-dideoxygalactose transaminase
MKIPFVDLVRQYVPIKNEIKSEIDKVIESCYFVNGPVLKEFENNFSDYIGTEFCAGVGSGTDALIIALKAIGVGPGDSVLVPDQTYISTMSAVTLVGAEPIVVPCDKKTFCMDPSVIYDYIVENTAAMIYVHLYGNPGEFDKIERICYEKGIYLIEDAAQAVGASFNDKKCGSLGRIGCFSFYPSKNLGCFGQGGAITTNSKDVYDYVKRYANCGMETAEKVWGTGINSRLDDIQAAILNVNLKHIDEWNIYRNILADLYKSKLDSRFKIQYIPKSCYSSYHLFVINIPEANKVIEYLSENGIEARRHYAFSMSDVLYNGGNYFSMLSLPMHPYMTEDEVSYICDVLNDWGKNGE